MTSSLTRRAALVGAFASATALGVSGVAVAQAHRTVATRTSDPDAALLSLVAEWELVREIVNNDPVDYGDFRNDPNLMLLWAIEAQLAVVKPQTVRGFAAKVLIATSYGGHALEGVPAEIIFGDALALAPKSMRDCEEAHSLREYIAADASRGDVS